MLSLVKETLKIKGRDVGEHRKVIESQRTVTKSVSLDKHWGGKKKNT